MPVSTLCKYIGLSSLDCILCPDITNWLFKGDGKCYDICPDKYYKNSLINQCRSCDPTCFSCSSFSSNNCLSCEGFLYFYSKENKCVPDCNVYNLTKSLTQNNTCVFCKIIL